MGITFVPEMAAETRSGCQFIPIEDEHAASASLITRRQTPR
jgi:hypothetical protein